MKKWICAALAMVMLLGCAGAVAQEYVSIQEVYDQAQAMGGWWKETFETPNGEVTIDAPIIVPDVERMPVFTVEPAKPLTQELYNTIVQGKKTSKSRITIQYELEYNAVMQEFYLGREEDGKYGYDAVNVAWVQRGDYRFSQGTGVASDARPKSYHYPWELDFDQAYVRGSDQTLNDMITLWQKDIELCYPDDEYVVKPKRIYINGSVLAEIDGEGKKYKKDGDCFIYGEQYFFDFPLIGSIGSCDGENKLWVSHVSSRETNKVFDKMAKYNMGSSGECYNQNRFLSANNEDNRKSLGLQLIKNIFPFLQDDEVEFVYNFKEKSIHLPMFYLLYHFITRNTSRYASLTCRFYGIDQEPEDLDEISYKLGLSRERCRQLIATNELKDSSILKAKGERL